MRRLNTIFGYELCSILVAACGGSIDVLTGGTGAAGGQGGAGGTATTGGGGSGGTAGSGGSTTSGGTTSTGETGGTGGNGGTGAVEPFCGDGTIDAGEACDDGNTEDGDACSPACTIALLKVTSPNAIAEWPDVTSTQHDGGQGFLIVWRSNSPQISVMAAAVTAKGALSDAAKVHGGNLPPAAVPFPGGRAFVGARNLDASLFAGTIDATTLAQVDEIPIAFPTEVATLRLHLAANEVGAGLAEVATAHSGPADPETLLYPIQGCLLHPSLTCFPLGLSPVSTDPVIAAAGDHFVAGFRTGAGFELTRFDGAGVIGTQSVDAPFSSSLSHLVARPGGFVLASQSLGQPCIHHRLLGEDLVPLGPAQLVEGSCEAEGSYQPRVAVGPTGRYVVAFWDIPPGANLFTCRVRAAAFEADGTPSGPTFEVSEGTDCSSEVRVAANPAGDVLFVWNRDNFVADVIEAKLVPKLLE